MRPWIPNPESLTPGNPMLPFTPLPVSPFPAIPQLCSLPCSVFCLSPSLGLSSFPNTLENAHEFHQGDTQSSCSTPGARGEPQILFTPRSGAKTHLKKPLERKFLGREPHPGGWQLLLALSCVPSVPWVSQSLFKGQIPLQRPVCRGSDCAAQVQRHRGDHAALQPVLHPRGHVLDLWQQRLQVQGQRCHPR